MKPTKNTNFSKKNQFLLGCFLYAEVKKIAMQTRTMFLFSLAENFLHNFPV